MNTEAILLAIPWMATFACMFISIRLANVFLRHNARLYTVMALFACCWAILLPYYSGSVSPPNIYRAISGFLLVYIGGLLVLDAEHVAPKGIMHIVDWRRVGLILLYLLAVPPISGKLNLFSQQQVEVALGIVIDVIGFVSLALGVSKICKPAAYRSFMAILIAYGITEIWIIFLVWQKITPENPTIHIPALFGYLVSAEKLLIASSFGAIVAYSGMTGKVRDRGPSYWLLKLVGGAKEAHDPDHPLPPNTRHPTSIP